jgi:hypothetical protein
MALEAAEKVESSVDSGRGSRFRVRANAWFCHRGKQGGASQFARPRLACANLGRPYRAVALGTFVSWENSSVACGQKNKITAQRLQATRLYTLLALRQTHEHLLYHTRLHIPQAEASRGSSRHMYGDAHTLRVEMNEIEMSVFADSSLV